MEDIKNMTAGNADRENTPFTENGENTDAAYPEENSLPMAEDAAQTAADVSEATPAVSDVPEKSVAAPKKKKKKALRIVLIILAVIFALLIAAGVYVFRLMNALSRFQPTNNKTTESSVTNMTDTEPGTVPDSTELTSAEGESVSGTPSDVSGETESDTAVSGEEAVSTQEPAGSTVQEGSSAAEEVTTASQSVTEKPTQTQGNTSPVRESTTAVPPTSAPVTEPRTPAPENGKTEYDIYRSGQFYATGTMTDDTGTVSPMELAIAPGSVYMVSDFEGASIGLLHSDKKTYMIYPEKKIYLEMNAAVLKLIGIDIGDMFDTSSFGFEDMEPLAKATEISHSDINGVLCDRYTFTNKDDGTLNYVYMNGTKLIRIQSLGQNGRVASQIDFAQITETVPADKRAVSSDYSKKTLIKFLEELGEFVN